jgi:hypothetical protein
MTTTRLKPNQPRIAKRPKQRMAVVVTHGEPADALAQVAPALYGSVYRHKFALKKAGKETFKVGALFGRWPDAHTTPRERWTGIWALPVPAGTRALPQAEPGVPVALETWDYGPAVAEVLHIGPYSAEGPTIQALHAFIAANGYQIAGVHEEEYLTSPRAKVQKTIIRYPVRRAAK